MDANQFVTLQSATVNASNLAISDYVEWNFIHLIYCPCAAVLLRQDTCQLD
jgi:hypothetical protein